MNTIKSDKQTKKEASMAEYKRCYEKAIQPPQDIHVECSDGHYVRYAWQNGRKFGWYGWIKCS